MLMPTNMQKYYVDIKNIVVNKDILKKIENYKKDTAIALLKLGITKGSFHDFFVNSYDYDTPENRHGEELFTLDQILENYQSQNWLNLFPDRVQLKDKYPEVGKRYLQITSIEGEGSYFYDIQTDYVYDVNWGQEGDMITGKLKPWFTSFYDFLEWYYSESGEE